MGSLNDFLVRRFTKILETQKDKTVYDLFEWKYVDVIMKDYKTGDLLTHMEKLEFPINYSQNACDIIASKYFRKTGIPNEFGYENSMRQVAHRMGDFWKEALIDEGLLKTKEEESIFYDEVVFAILNQMFAPNSPQWFNTGLCQSYGIKGNKNGLFYFDEKSRKVKECEDNYTRTQASACFILSIQDKLLGPHSISEQYVTETKLFKGGSGTGTNFSNIRAKNEQLSGGGVSSGLMSFLKGLDRNAGAIKSGGTTRRAAKMLCLDVDHPEILDFITWKAREEDKVRALGKMGYDTDMNGEAYETVSGQNGNNSVRFTDEFMEKVSNITNDPSLTETIELKGRMDDSVNRSIDVKELWGTFNESAWKCADPAPLFADRFNAWHTCPAGKDGQLNAKYNQINSTNPCGEYAFLDDTACNLASINIYKFLNEDNSFDIEGYVHTIRLVTLILESSIHWGQFPTKDIAENTYLFRTVGLGLSNLASILMVMGYPYDSEEGRAVASALAGILTAEAYNTSSLIAKEVGPFQKYEINKEYMQRVMRNHARAAGVLETEFEGLNYKPACVDRELLNKEGLNVLSDALNESFKSMLDNSSLYGFRNAQATVMAPTGTISFAMDCAATSIEPFFSHVIYKKLSGGGFMTVTNPCIEGSLRNLGYNENEILDILNYILKKEKVVENGFEYEKIVDGKIEGAPHLKEEHLPIFDTANVCGKGTRCIEPKGHVLMVAALTPLISGSISKTVNLPKWATVEDFKSVVFTSWKLGIKGITLYRDASKVSQPLNNSLNDDVDNTKLSYSQLLEKVKLLENRKVYTTREKPNGIRHGTTHPAQIEDVKIYTTVNRRENGEISEVYITTDREGTIITGLLNSLSKSISVMLQYHVPPQDIARMLRGQKYEPYGYVQKHPYIKYVSSISDLVSKIIDIELGDFSRCQVKPDCTEECYTQTDALSKDTEKYEKVYGSTCPSCSSTRMVRNGTCMVCLDCGSTTGCS